MASLLNCTIGEYRLVDFLGAGGMGEVYRAVHPKLGRAVAIKALTVIDAKSVQRFMNEARIQARLRHPGIATLYDLTEYRGRPCIVMELVEGETLAQRLRRVGPLPAGEALAMFQPIVESIAYIHSQGIVHRDLKANNVKITPSGEVKLLDFGIARVPGSVRLTQEGFLIGTAENFSPEQLEGKEADAHSDIWALGVLLYEMTTGRLPFEAPTVSDLYPRILRAQCQPPSALNPALPPGIDEIAKRCLKKKPSERYGSARELLDSVVRLRAGEAALPASTRRTWIAAGAGAIAVAGAAFFFSRTDENGETPAPPRVEPVAQRTVTVEVIGGVADVFQAGKRVGATPYEVSARPGEKVELLLRRDGFLDLPVEFETGERKSYSYTMEPARR